MKVNWKTVVKACSVIAVMLWMGLIFYLSHQPATVSDELSKNITEKLADNVDKVIPEIRHNMSYSNHIVRKNAHFFIYFVLGILMLHAIKGCGYHGWKSVLVTIGVCVLYAVTDEVHQLFVAGRGAQIKDVAVDSAGAVTGVALYWLAMFIGNKITSRKKVGTNPS